MTRTLAQLDLSRWFQRQRWADHGFVKNVLVVISGTAVAQIIGLAFAPVLSRLYGPAEFGVFGAYVSVASVLGAAATLNYAEALVLPQTAEQAGALFVLACGLGLGVASIALLGCSLMPTAWRMSLGLDGLGWLWWLLPLSVLLQGASQAITAWCVRLAAFGKTARAQLVRSASLAVAQGLGGLGGLRAGGLAGGSLLADASTIACLGRSVWPESRAVWRGAARWSQLRAAAGEYRQFALFGCPQNVLNALSQGIPVIALAHFYGVAAAGAYAFGLKLLQAPLTLVSNSIRPVLFQRLGRIAAGEQELYRPFVRCTTALAAMVAAPACLGFLVAPRLFAWLLGPDWRIAGEFARWLLLWLAPMFCNVPAMLAARVLRWQWELFLLDVALLGGRVAALVGGGLWLDPVPTVAVLSLLGAFFNILVVVFIGVRLRRRWLSRA